MPLRKYKRPSGWYHIRGSHHGVLVDESANTRDPIAAEKVREAREREIFEQVVLGKKPRRTFADAAEGYMKGGGERRYLHAILTAKIKVDRKAVVFGVMFLDEIDQAIIDDVALALYPRRDSEDSERKAKATRNRQVYTPISSVMTWASEQKSWGFSHGRIRRPEEPKGRIDWRTPKEIEWWLERAGHAKGLLTFYAGTGARASEVVGDEDQRLDWKDVTPGGQRVTFWGEKTKSGNDRSIDLQMRVRTSLPPRPDTGKGPVFLNDEGKPWHNYDAINLLLRRISMREAGLAATDLEREQIAELNFSIWSKRKIESEVRAEARRKHRALITAIIEREDIPTIHCHIFRHTWATWAYAVTRDLTFVMSQGGWATEKLALRYIHGAAADLADDVLAHGWEIRPAPESGATRLRLAGPSANTAS